MNNISVIVSTQNAQDIIRACLDSAQWAAEIVVVDAASSDRTVEIACEYTNRVIKVDAQLNSGQRWNLGIEAASKDWIFILESDKRISTALRTEIENVVNKHKLEEVNGYAIKTKNYFLGHWVKIGGFWPDDKLYLFRRQTARFEPRHKGNIIFKGKFQNLDGYIEHYVYRSLQQCFSKVNEESDRLAAEYFTQQCNFKKRYIVTKPWRIFKKQYWKQGGSREGLLGLLFCLLNVFERFLIYAKRWEIEQASCKR